MPTRAPAAPEAKGDAARGDHGHPHRPRDPGHERERADLRELTLKGRAVCARRVVNSRRNASVPSMAHGSALPCTPAIGAWMTGKATPRSSGRIMRSALRRSQRSAPPAPLARASTTGPALRSGPKPWRSCRPRRFHGFASLTSILPRPSFSVSGSFALLRMTARDLVRGASEDSQRARSRHRRRDRRGPVDPPRAAAVADFRSGARRWGARPRLAVVTTGHHGAVVRRRRHRSCEEPAPRRAHAAARLCAQPCRRGRERSRALRVP